MVIFRGSTSIKSFNKTKEKLLRFNTFHITLSVEQSWFYLYNFDWWDGIFFLLVIFTRARIVELPEPQIEILPALIRRCREPIWLGAFPAKGHCLEETLADLRLPVETRNLSWHRLESVEDYVHVLFVDYLDLLSWGLPQATSFLKVKRFPLTLVTGNLNAQSEAGRPNADFLGVIKGIAKFKADSRSISSMLSRNIYKIYLYS